MDMKKLFLILVLLAIIGGVVYKLFMPDSTARHKIYSNLQAAQKAIDKLPKPKIAININVQEKMGFSRSDKAGNSSGEKIALHFKDGSVMVGELISKTKEEYVIKWKGQETLVYAELVDHVTSAQEELKKKDTLSNDEISQFWPYKNDIVIRLKNNVIMDAKIDSVNDKKAHLIYEIEGGGSIEQDILLADIEYLIFKPIDNDESKKIELSLKELFPKMNFYKEGNFTVVTDSYDTWVEEYKKVLRQAYTNIYFNFFSLLKERGPQYQNFVVIFDDYAGFVEYAVADGVPGWAVAGYFNPEDKVLYLFNVLGEKFSEVLFQGVVGETGKSIDQVVETIENQVDKRYHVIVEGRAKQVKDKFWAAYSYYKDMFKDATLNTLRHEFTHEVFYNWGMQNISISKVEGMKEDFVKKKKEFLETKDYKKKAHELRQLIIQRGENALSDMKAANSWLVEGIATYSETEEPGAQNDMWLFIYQEMVKRGAVYPLEFFMAYKIGSFPGVYSKAMLDLYAQSWAFVSFLMKKYPKEFIDYQNRLAGKDAKGSEDVSWLSEALGKDLRAIEKEFTEFMDTYEKLEDPSVRHFDRLYHIYN